MVTRRMLWCTAAVALAITMAAPAAAFAGMSDTDREGKYEVYFPVRWIGSDSFSASGGTSVDVNPDVGWGFGFAWNATDEIAVQFELDWTSANFDANIVTDVGNSTVGGTLDATSAIVAVQYNIMPKNFTPFITLGAGWTWADSNIPTGPPQGACWWSPWYGYICSSWQPTASESAFTYGVGLGLRGELGKGFYLEGAYNWNWNNFDVADSFEGFRLDIGWKF